LGRVAFIRESPARLVNPVALIDGPACVGKNYVIGFRSTVFNAKEGPPELDSLGPEVASPELGADSRVPPELEARSAAMPLMLE
jgi:hypothetical protein